jgi:phenylalanyl-tRNA synthetase beta chain
MKITHNWLREFTYVDPSPQEVAAQLTLAGLEIEAVEAVAPAFTGVVVGEVVECTRHPDAEKLAVCRVTTDGENRLQIICGAPNVRAGIKVAVAMVGATLPNDVHISRAKLRGLESNGMLCSARELGLGTEHDGILELSSSLTLNEDIRIALDLDDHALEVNATPNRGDCMSVFGIARDYSAARDRRYLPYPTPHVVADHQTTFPVTLAAPQACPVFGTRLVRGVKAGVHAPAWIKERLRRVGINSISAIVDVTNYVMVELGQPMHAYDFATLSQGIVVRQARAGERITLLDDREHELDPDYLVISDASGAIGLAGIMGGRRTAISDATHDVLLEAAHFTPAAVAGRARRLGLFTDAGQRFERGVDPQLVQVALERATQLLIESCGGIAGPLHIERAGRAAEPEWVGMRRTRLSRLLGAPVPDEEARAVLDAISETVEDTADGWRVRRPSHRFDIHLEVDLIEEVARLRGFDTIPERHAVAPQIAGHASEARVSNERLLTAFADRGYREIISYTFVDPALQRQLFPEAATLALSNPLSAELAEMRVSLWPSLLQACRENLRRQQSRVRLFEIGMKFVVSAAPAQNSLHEIETLAGVMIGSRWPEQWGAQRVAVDFYDVKADLLGALALAGATSSLRFVAEQSKILHPGRCARIYRGSDAVGWLGELHPKFVKTFGLPSAPLLFELELTEAFLCNSISYKEISKYPSVRRDLAVVVDESVPLAVLQENVSVAAAKLLAELRVFDVYRGPNVEIGRKSIALGLILQDSSRTLTDVDADAVVAQVVARLRDVLSATIRDQ